MKRELTEDEYILETKSSLLKLYGTNRPNILTHSFSSTVEQSIILMDYSGEIEGELMRIITPWKPNHISIGIYIILLKDFGA